MELDLSLSVDASPARDLRSAIVERTATVAVVGLGYVGLPLITTSSRAGFPVIGLDSDPAKIEALRAGHSYIVDVSDRDLQRVGSASFTDSASALRGADVIVIAVPTPLTDGVPDLALVTQACADVSTNLRGDGGQLVVLESTTYPGTTEELVRPMLETSGLRAGRDFFLAYSPERIDPGRGEHLQDTPKIVSGIGAADTELAELFYGQLVRTVVVTPRPRDAEMAKLLENTFRQVNIALVNELATLARDLDVDIWAAIEAAATKPFGFMPFWPGPGVGGHCIAIDPSYLSWRSGQRRGFSISFVELAREVNNRMPAYVTSRIGEALNEAGKPIKGSRIMAIGVAYKPEVNDLRESPALMVMERLARSGARCSYHDPFIPAAALCGELVESQPLTAEVLANQDCVAILAAHRGVDYDLVVSSSQLVFDAQGVTRRSDARNVVRL